MAKRKDSGSRFFWGFVFGLAAGVALAVLFAPQPGEETREQLTEQSEVLRKRGQVRMEQLRKDFQERYADAIVQGREAYDRARDEVMGRYTRAKNVE